MPENMIWIIKSKQKNPNDFYVKVDGSEFYIAFWVASAKNKDDALLMTHTAVSELALGETEIINIYSYARQGAKESLEVSERILDTVKAISLNKQEDVQLAAWSSASGRLW